MAAAVKQVEVNDTDVTKLLEALCEKATLNDLSPDQLEACARLKRGLESQNDG